MPVTTRVLELSRTASARLDAALRANGYESRTVPYATFSHAKPGTVVTYYTSGKLVIQSSELDLFLARFLPDVPTEEIGGADDERIGSDEAGKGDYFGPLVVAGVFVKQRDIARLRKIGVADSKQLSDETIARIAGALEVSTIHAVRVLMPEDYNKRHKVTGNVNIMLGELHAAVILDLSSRTGCRRALTDQFGDRHYITDAFGGMKDNIELQVRPRAEEHVAVAAASILARHAFVKGIESLSEECGVDLPKGAGAPVEKSIRNVVQVIGRGKLNTIAKVHFKTTEKILGQLF